MGQRGDGLHGVSVTVRAVRRAGGSNTHSEGGQHISKWRTNTRGDWLLGAGDVASAWAGAGLSWWLLP